MGWREKYASKLVSMDEAVRKIKSGDTLAAGIATGVPYKLLDALADYSLGHLEDVEFYYGAGFKPYKMGMPPFNGHLNVKSFFFGPIERAFVAHGFHFPYQPIHLSQTTRDRCRTHRGNVLLKVLSQYCKSCGYCVHYCPKKALSFGNERNGLGVFFPVVDEEKCIACGICATVCPDAALELREEENNG